MPHRRWLLVLRWVLSVVLGHRYASVWQSDPILWNYAVMVTPLNPVARMNAAVVNHTW